MHCFAPCLINEGALQTIIFDEFKIWEGRCGPGHETPGQIVAKPDPVWEGIKKWTGHSNLDLRLETKTFVGGGSVKFHVKNTSERDCDAHQIHLNIRPGWGHVKRSAKGGYVMHGTSVVPSATDEDEGLFFLIVTRRSKQQFAADNLK